MYYIITILVCQTPGLLLITHTERLGLRVWGSRLSGFRARAFRGLCGLRSLEAQGYGFKHLGLLAYML